MSHDSSSSSLPRTPLDLPFAVEVSDMDDTVRTPGMARSFASGRTILALMLREMSTRYGRTVGGYFWSVIEPVSAIFILALGFSLLIRSPSLGSNFFLFYASGYIPFHLYQQISVTGARSISFSRPLLFYPAVTWVDAVLARFILNALTGIMVSYLTLLIVMMTLDTRTVIDVGPVLLAGLLSMALGFGIGTINCALEGLYPTWEIIWSIITRPLFLASGILFIYEDMPQGVQNILWYNPLMHITGIFREGIFPLYEPEYVSTAYVLIIAFSMTTLGLMMLRRFNREILENG